MASAFDLTRKPPLGLRIAATAVAIAAGYFLVGLLLRGQALAPWRSMLGGLPAAPLALAHAILIIADAWWAGRGGVVRALVMWAVLLGGMLLVAAGTDAAAAQFQRLGFRSLVEGHAVPLGLLVAVQGALGVLQAWSRRAAAR